MKKSKLTELFSQFNRKEYRWFRDFLASPYFNKNEDIIRLGDIYLQLAKKGFPPKATQAESIFATLFPRQPFDEKKLTYLSSDLLQLGERFLAQRHFEAEEENNNLVRLRACYDRKLKKSYHANLRKSTALLQREQPLSPKLLYQRFQLQAIMQEEFAQSGERTASPHLQGTADQLDNCYFANKLKLSCGMLNIQLALNHEYTQRFTQADYLREIDELPNNVLPRLYALAFRLLQTENREDLLDTYFSELTQCATRLDAIEVTELFYYAINYTARQFRLGHRHFATSLLRIYQTGLDRGFLLEDNVLSPWNYKNIVKLGLGLRQFEWVKDVVNQYTDLLPPENRSDARHFNLADIAYHQQQYDQAFHHLGQTEFTDVYYAIGAKVMLIKIYYETGAEEALLALLFSFRLFLMRNRLVGQATKDVYLNFVRFTKKLQRATDVKDLEALKNSILGTKALSERNWLLRQIAEKTLKL
ncbi:MAG: hypothetical protein AAF828_05490 [Bacteroidota bacterium]